MSNIKILVWRCAELVIVLFLCSCSGNGYITSSVSTVLGLDVSENPKTQVPHVRFGYVRNGLYYVPTGKTLTTTSDNGGIVGPASETPTVVSEIFVNSKFLSDITISEKFAIGNAAVQSNAANATFSIPAAQAVASNSGVDAAAVAAARTTALNRTVRQPEAVSQAEFTRLERKRAEQEQARSAIVGFVQMLRSVSRDPSLSDEQKRQIYVGVVTDAGLAGSIKSEDPNAIITFFEDTATPDQRSALAQALKNRYFLSRSVRKPETVSRSEFEKLQGKFDEQKKASSAIAAFVKTLRSVSRDPSLSNEQKQMIYAGVVQDAGLAGSINPDPNAIIQFFEDEATPDQQNALSNALNNRYQTNNPPLPH